MSRMEVEHLDVLANQSWHNFLDGEGDFHRSSNLRILRYPCIGAQLKIWKQHCPHQRQNIELLILWRYSSKN